MTTNRAFNNAMKTFKRISDLAGDISGNLRAASPGTIAHARAAAVEIHEQACNAITQLADDMRAARG